MKDRNRVFEKGQSMTEYALILGFVSIVVLVVLAATGTSIQDVYCSVIKAIGGSGCSFVPDLWNTIRGNWNLDEPLCGGPGEGRIFADGFSGEDYTVNIDSAELAKGNGYGVYFRASNEAKVNGYTFQFDPGYRGGSFIFRKWVNGRELNPPFAVAKAPAGFDWHNSNHNVQVKMNGDQFTAYVDGKEVLNGQDSTYKDGGFGLRTWDGTKACFSDISATTP